MNNLKIFLSLTVATLSWSCNRPSADYRQTINSLLGDISFISKFGYSPNEKTDEDLRIKTHLQYVESLLRQQDISKLSSELKQKRNYLLDLLHTYWKAGIFPRNYDYKDQRQPCLIDKEGRICAVGYLIEQTTNRQTAEQINSNNKYDKVLAMNDNLVDNWIEGSGLSKQECAMIQPSYSPRMDTIKEEKKYDGVFIIVEEMPIFPGGDEGLLNYINENKSKECKNRLIYITFLVDTDGVAKNQKILRGFGGFCDDMALKLIDLMPKWTPGRQSGRVVKVQYNVPIRFDK